MKIIFQTVLLLVISVLLFSCDPAPVKAKKVIYFIPENTTVIFKIEDFHELQSDIKNNSFLTKLKNTHPYTFFSKKNFFNHLHPTSKSLICISKTDTISEFTFIARQTDSLFITDSIKNVAIENLLFKKHPLRKITIDEHSLFATVKDSVMIASSSLQILQNILDGHTKKEAILSKITNLKNTQDFTTIVPLDKVNVGDLQFNFASWAAIDVEILPDALLATGVVLANDSVPQLISVFKGQQPQHNDIAKVTPVDAKTVVSFTFNDFDLFQKNLQGFRGLKNTNTEETLLFEAITEVSKITLPQGSAIVLKSFDTELTHEALSNYSKEKETFKNVIIYDFSKPDLFKNQFLTFTNKTKPTTVFKLDDFFIFSENEAVTQHIINSFLTNNCLSETSYYKNILPQLSDESSLQIIKLNGNYSESISNLIKTNIGNITFKKYPLAILQFSYDRNFAHLNFVCKEASSKKRSSKKVSQLASIKLKNELLNDPQFFSNHRTGGKDIVVQDVSNKLYFISVSGKTLWTKTLKDPILGKIKEIDLLRNGKKQLAFVTKHRFYILDRTGREVSPFPIKFNDDITQPLSVFDYDNNRKYRFLITQGKEVLMLDSKGKTVKGFKFKKASSDIVFSPQHFRIQSKDYIVVAEKSGKLNILSRVGKSRISVSKTFDFSSNPITIEGKKMVIITNDNKKYSIGVDGKIATRKLNVSSYQFRVKGKTKVTLDDNLMRINGVLVELPFGIYTAPKIHIFKRKVYVSVTETQENKIYLFTKSGDIISGFPVYGTSRLDLADATNNKKVNIIVKGGSKEILLYEFK